MRGSIQEADYRQHGLLRACCERPTCRSTADNGDELAPLH
jgi:hypothetical protein